MLCGGAGWGEHSLARDWSGFLHTGGRHLPGRPFPPGQHYEARLAHSGASSGHSASRGGLETRLFLQGQPARGPHPGSGRAQPALSRRTLASSGTRELGRARGVGALDAEPLNLPAATRGRCRPCSRSAAGHCAGVGPGTSALSFRARPDCVHRRPGPPRAGSNRQVRGGRGRPAHSRSRPRVARDRHHVRRVQAGAPAHRPRVLHVLQLLQQQRAQPRGGRHLAALRVPPEPRRRGRPAPPAPALHRPVLAEAAAQVPERSPRVAAPEREAAT